LHIRAQNAGLIVRRSSDQYTFESFEISPTNDAVIGTKGRLRRCFPGPALVVDQDRILDARFLEPLVELITQLHAETPQEVLPIVKKARSNVVETRDTVNPRFVNEMLTGILRAVGQPLDVSRFYKHTREDVLWNDSFKPWRRSPLWLFLRVILQTSLMRNDDEQLHFRYKSFMLFFMAHVLNCALEASLPSDILFIMTAKISRRALKLGGADSAAWLPYVETVMKATQQELNRRWNSVQKQPDYFRTQLNWLSSQSSFLHDTGLTLSRLRPYLAAVRGRSASPTTYHPFISDCGPRISQSSSSLPDMGLLRGTGGYQIRLHLGDLEHWVQESLNDWLRANLEREDACTALKEVIDAYTLAASSAYADIPEDISLMVLALMDLWVALDKCALHHYPLLRDYDPGFPPSVFEPLLLPKKPQMGRLFHVEQYLATRRKQCKPGFPSIFRAVGTNESFAVRYFQQSPHHQKLRREVESQAANDRSRKMIELATKIQQHDDLMRRSDGMSCEYVSWWRKHREITYHSGSCQKCQLRGQAKGLTIDVHEWPLPNSDLEAKAAVFELDVPIVVSKWRDSTHSILVDVLSGKFDARTRGNGNPQKVYTLHGYSGLQKFVKSQAARLQLASEDKPFVDSHYRCLEVYNADEAKICVNNGLHYSWYDSERTRFTEELLGWCDLREKCTLKLPAGPYSELQYAVNSTSHTSNGVIASQAQCAEALNMHEFYAFGTLRSGHRLQWRNIARELRARILNFDCQETHTLFTQAAWQVGPFSNGEYCRESHADLEEEHFGNSLLSALGDAIGTIEGNWQGAAASRTFIALASRLLSLSTSNVVREGCYRFLRRARAISLRWTRELAQKLQEGQQEELKVLNRRTLEMALTCHWTFDVDPQHLPYLLKTGEDIAVVTECSIIVHDRCPAVIEDLPNSMKALVRQYWRSSLRLEPLLRKLILENRFGLDSTVSRLWAGYVPGSPWTALETPGERWLVTDTTSKGGQSSMVVHYNLMDGTMLVNGLPLTRLPRSYESHPTFRRLFGEVK
jgi:hypothetical protein